MTRVQASNLLRELRPASDVAQRMRRAAELLIGRSYLDHPLIGGPDRAERLVLRLDAFDCVTFVETVLALSRSRTPAGFKDELRRIRYRGGKVAWRSRLHYFSDWLAANHRRGALRVRSGGAGSRLVRARLSLLEGFPARTTRFRVIPRRGLSQAARRLGAVSIVAFASVRAGLDFFHTGLLVRDPPDQPVAALSLIHAARRQGCVVREPLGAFLKRNRTRGIAFASPRPKRGTR